MVYGFEGYDGWDVYFWRSRHHKIDFICYLLTYEHVLEQTEKNNARMTKRELNDLFFAALDYPEIRNKDETPRKNWNELDLQSTQFLNHESHQRCTHLQLCKASKVKQIFKKRLQKH